MGNGRASKLQCSMCQRSFRRTEHLTRHERSHRNERPFSCDRCDARFTRKDLIKGHMARHHKNGTTQETRQLAATDTVDASSCPPYYQSDPLPQLWEPPGQEAMFASNLELDEMLANAETPSFAYFGNDMSAYLAADPDCHGSNHWNPVVSDGSPSNPNAPVPSATSVNTGPTPENSWHTAFDILEDKRREMATAMSHGLQPSQAESLVAIPSAIAFRRYIAVFFDVFHTSLPFIHGPSWRANDQEPALLFSIAAIGAATCGKTSLSFELHRSAQLFLWKHLHARGFNPRDQPIWVAQSLLLIMFFGTYSGNPIVMQDVLPFQSNLAGIVRHMINVDDFRSVSRDDPNLSWEAWIGIETIIRTTFAIYIYFGQLNLVLNLPFSLVNSEMKIHLPCSEEEWHVSTLESWSRFRQQKKPCLILFTDALKLLAADQQELSVGSSPFGALVMLHGILQRMWQFRQFNYGESTSAQIELFENNLRRWRAMYDIGLHQSSLTSSSLPRALELDASSLLKFAYYTLYANLHHPKPTLLTHSIGDVVSAVRKQILDPPGSPSNTKAAKCSTQVLLIIFNSGFVWRNKILTGASSLQLHIISSLECCLYLSTWIAVLYSIEAASWSQEEREIVSIVESMLQEMDISPENCDKAIHVQLLYAWCGMFKDAGQTGVGQPLVNSIQRYVDQI